MTKQRKIIIFSAWLEGLRKGRFVKYKVYGVAHHNLIPTKMFLI